MNIKTIPNFSNYAVTKDGKVWSIKSKKFLSPRIQRGYGAVGLCKNGKVYDKKIHRLVLEVFVGKCPAGMESCHNNGNRLDNRLDNLRWGTRSDNIKDAIKHGTHNRVKLTERDVRIIIYMYRTGLFTQREIGEIYNVTKTNIGRIINKKIWKHIWRN